jgi:aminopeptidase N
MVLHMLRRLVGDDSFFKGVREFYESSEFQKAGTADFQAVMERVSGRTLGRFFDAWIFGEAIPRIKFSYQIDKDAVNVRFDQQSEPVDIPITVTITYTSGETSGIVVPVLEKTTSVQIPLAGVPRSVQANADSSALAVIVK